MFRKLFLPIGIAVSIAISFIWPEPGIFFKSLRYGDYLTANNLMIVITFLVCGWNLDVGKTRFDRKFILLFLGGAVMALFISPLLGVGVSRIFRLTALPATGLIVAAAMPPTLSSGIVLTETANGNSLLSILMTVGYNLMSVVTIPLMLALCISSEGNIDTNPVKMFVQLVMLVLLPSVIGFAAGKLAKRKLPPFFTYLSSTAVIMLVWGFFSASCEHFKQHPVSALLQEGAGALVLHLALLLIVWYGSALLKIGKPERKALLFTGVSKTITITITILTIIGATTGAALVPALVYYFVQSIVDSALAGKMGLSEVKSEC
ncbi:MAG: bile acid:sodium symporter [Lentisphaerae bacterium]|nr:bile acid:sodium symporter [Lentisphaerota bacterium]